MHRFDSAGLDEFLAYLGVDRPPRSFPSSVRVGGHDFVVYRDPVEDRYWFRSAPLGFGGDAAAVACFAFKLSPEKTLERLERDRWIQFNCVEHRERYTNRWKKQLQLWCWWHNAEEALRLNHRTPETTELLDALGLRLQHVPEVGTGDLRELRKLLGYSPAPKIWDCHIGLKIQRLPGRVDGFWLLREDASYYAGIKRASLPGFAYLDHVDPFSVDPVVVAYDMPTTLIQLHACWARDAAGKLPLVGLPRIDKLPAGYWTALPNPLVIATREIDASVVLHAKTIDAKISVVPPSMLRAGGQMFPRAWCEWCLQNAITWSVALGDLLDQCPPGDAPRIFEAVVPESERDAWRQHASPELLGKVCARQGPRTAALAGRVVTDDGEGWRWDGRAGERVCGASWRVRYIVRYEGKRTSYVGEVVRHGHVFPFQTDDPTFPERPLRWLREWMLDRTGEMLDFAPHIDRFAFGAIVKMYPPEMIFVPKQYGWNETAGIFSFPRFRVDTRGVHHSPSRVTALLDLDVPGKCWHPGHPSKEDVRELASSPQSASWIHILQVLRQLFAKPWHVAYRRLLTIDRATQDAIERADWWTDWSTPSMMGDMIAWLHCASGRNDVALPLQSTAVADAQMIADTIVGFIDYAQRRRLVRNHPKSLTAEIAAWWDSQGGEPAYVLQADRSVLRGSRVSDRASAMAFVCRRVEEDCGERLWSEDGEQVLIEKQPFCRLMEQHYGVIPKIVLPSTVGRRPCWTIPRRSLRRWWRRVDHN